MRTKLIKGLAVTLVVVLSGLTAGCGEFIRSDRAAVTVVITELVAGEGANPQAFAGTLRSDVCRLRNNRCTIFDDMARVTMTLVLKDRGIPSITNVPSPTNTVTINRYRVTFRRSDGRNTAGVDVPFPFESALTFTVPAEGVVSGTFELIRHTSKVEPPLGALTGSLVVISTIADVTFFGRDQAGNNVSTTGSLGVLFGDFADPVGS